MQAHLVAVLEPSTFSVLGYEIRGPNMPDPFDSGRHGTDRATAVVMTVNADTFARAIEWLCFTLRDHPGAGPMVANLQATGQWRLPACDGAEAVPCPSCGSTNIEPLPEGTGFSTCRWKCLCRSCGRTATDGGEEVLLYGQVNINRGKLSAIERWNAAA